jgi:hypothetical protein
MDFRIEFGCPGLSDHFVEVHHLTESELPWHFMINRVEADGSYRAVYTMDARSAPGLGYLELMARVIAIRGDVMVAGTSQGAADDDNATAIAAT